MNFIFILTNYAYYDFIESTQFSTFSLGFQFKKSPRYFTGDFLNITFKF